MHFADFSLDFWEANLHATPPKYMHIVYFEDLLLYEVGECLKNWGYTKMNGRNSRKKSMILCSTKLGTRYRQPTSLMVSKVPINTFGLLKPIDISP